MLSGVGRDVLPQRFSADDEARFRRTLRRNLVYARTGIFVALALAFGLAPLYHDTFFRATSSVHGLMTLVEAGLVLPLCLAAAVLTAVPAPRRLVQGVQSAAVLAAALAVVAFRALALQGALQYPAQMVGVVMIAVAVFGLFSWRRVAAATVLVTACAIGVEYRFGDAQPVVQAYSLVLMALIATMAAYNLETLARFAWWESAQLRRIRGELLRSERSARLQSMTDELTGHYNRRGFQVLAEQELRHARRRRQQCALLFVDVDGLKDINEKHGHEGGDLALATVAEALRVAARNTDVVARLGGDEFLVLAVDSADPDALRTRIFDLIRGYNAAGTLPFALSVSVGASSIDPNDDQALDVVIAEADARMYAAKRSRVRGTQGA
ncbi:MAG TPA: GGDEF domain-containing protein [Verrucomicrobiae bacterium]|nr:GGDEF domain-containing protein [Verrucomicrobiae bacterium]